jgi:hypothetical protein
MGWRGIDEGVEGKGRGEKRGSGRHTLLWDSSLVFGRRMQAASSHSLCAMLIPACSVGFTHKSSRLL